jgi:hypothetical protein
MQYDPDEDHVQVLPHGAPAPDHRLWVRPQYVEPSVSKRDLRNLVEDVLVSCDITIVRKLVDLSPEDRALFSAMLDLREREWPRAS